MDKWIYTEMQYATECDCFAGESDVRVDLHPHHSDIVVRQHPRHHRHHIQPSPAHGHQHVLRLTGSQRLARRFRQHAVPAAVPPAQRVDARRAGLQTQQLRTRCRRCLQHLHAHWYCRRQVRNDLPGRY